MAAAFKGRAQNHKMSPSFMVTGTVPKC